MLLLFFQDFRLGFFGDDQLTQMLLMYAGTIFLFVVKTCLSEKYIYAKNASKWLARKQNHSFQTRKIAWLAPYPPLTPIVDCAKASETSHQDEEPCEEFSLIQLHGTKKQNIITTVHPPFGSHRT